MFGRVFNTPLEFVSPKWFIPGKKQKSLIHIKQLCCVVSKICSVLNLKFLPNRNSRLQMFFKIVVFRNSANFTGKQQRWSLFLIKLQASATFLQNTYSGWFCPKYNFEDQERNNFTQMLFNFQWMLLEFQTPY